MFLTAACYNIAAATHSQCRHSSGDIGDIGESKSFFFYNFIEHQTSAIHNGKTTNLQIMGARYCGQTVPAAAGGATVATPLATLRHAPGWTPVCYNMDDAAKPGSMWLGYAQMHAEGERYIIFTPQLQKGSPEYTVKRKDLFEPINESGILSCPETQK